MMMKKYGILVGVLLLFVLVIPAAAIGLPVFNSSWSGDQVYDNDITNWQAVRTGTGGLAHVVAQNATGQILIYGKETSPGVLPIPVEIADRSSEPGTTLGYGPAMAVNATDVVYVSYFINTTAGLEVGLASNEGGSWTNETVAAFPGVAYADTYRTAITLDGLDVHIICTNPDTDALVAIAYNETASSWENKTIANSAGPVSSVASSADGLYVSYDDRVGDKLMLVRYEAPVWYVPSPIYDGNDVDGGIGTQNAIAIGSDGYPRVLFTTQRFESFGDRLYLMKETGSGWGPATLLDERGTDVTYFTGVDLTMDGNTVHGVYAVSMVTSTDSTLRYLTDSSGTPETSLIANASDDAYLFAYPAISYTGAVPLIGTGYGDFVGYILRPVFNPSFTAEPTSGVAPLSVTVTANSIVTPTSVAWDFGNGDTGTCLTNSTVYTSPGTYTITMTAIYGVTEVIKEKTVTVTGAPSGDGSDLPEPEIQRASSMEPAAAGNATRASFNFTSDPVKNIEILGYVVPGDTTASVLALNGPPDDTVPPGQVWRYLEMSLAGIEKKDVMGAYVSFRIPAQVISSYGYTTEDVALVHLTDDGWERLPTVIEKKEGAYVYYRAYTPGFSYFAIIFDEKASIRDLPELEQVIEENTSGSESSTPTPEETPATTPTVTSNQTATIEPTKTPIPSVTVPVPEPTTTQESPAPLAGLLAGLGSCAAWCAWRRE